jgi:formamidopyrimidine-DNA glycosylase
LVTVVGGPLLRFDEDLNVALQLFVPVGRVSLARGSHGYNHGPVPELPDLDVVADALHAALAGRSVTGARLAMPLVVRGTPAELEALTGQLVVRVTRVGKLLDIQLDPDRVVVNPMLTGRFQLAGRGERAPAAVAVEWEFGPRLREPGAAAADWTDGAAWLPAGEAPVQVRYRDPTQMGKVYLLPAGEARSVPGLGPGEQGPDALDPTLTLDAWRARIRKHPGELKNLLRNQAFVAGIGNAYSDEILHAAGLQPFRKRSSLAPEEVDALYLAMRRVLENSILVLRERVPPTFEKQVRDQLAVHNRGGEACPRCGTRITQVTGGGFPTAWCRGCQR